jgi:hypothetical protein
MVVKTAGVVALSSALAGLAGASIASAIINRSIQEAELMIPPTPKNPTYPDHLKTTIVLSTTSLHGANFKKCYNNLMQHTSGQYQVIIVNSRFKESVYNHSRDMNVALKGADYADFYVLINNDVFVMDGWLDALINTALKDKRIGIVGGLYFYEDGVTIQHAGGCWDKNIAKINFHGSVGHRFYQKKITDVQEALKPCYTIFVTGALMLVTAECREVVGEWDENLASNWNDVDYCFRAWEAGFRVAYTPECKAIHKEGASLRTLGLTYPAYKHSLPHVLKKWNIKRLENIQKLVDEANWLVGEW